MRAQITVDPERNPVLKNPYVPQMVGSFISLVTREDISVWSTSAKLHRDMYAKISYIWDGQRVVGLAITINFW